MFELVDQLKLTLMFLVICSVSSWNSLRPKHLSEISDKSFIPKNCEWKSSECVPKNGRCGRGVMQLTLEGENCPTETKREHCRLSCRNKSRKKSGSRVFQSPSSAGLLGYTHDSARNKAFKAIADCEYVNSDWSRCDVSTNRMTKTLTLTKGDSSVCKQEKIIKKVCKRRKSRKNCVYSKSSWSECNRKTGHQTRTITLIKANSIRCPTSKSIRRRCKPDNVRAKEKCKMRKNPKKCLRRLEKKKFKVSSKGKGCRYIKKDWGPCDLGTNMKKRKLILIDGDPDLCLRKKVKTKKCKQYKTCRYRRGPWGLCNPVTHLKVRVDTLKPGCPESCNVTVNVTKPCYRKSLNIGDCKYQLMEWSNCSAETNERTRKRVLVEGDPSRCVKEKVITRSCLKHNGKERCIFKRFGQYGPCRNGVKTKTRQLISGPDTCQRKAAKTKSCKKSVATLHVGRKP